MKKLSTLLAVGVGAGALATPFAGADAGALASVKTDAVKLTADATAKHDLVIADAQKLQADAQAALGGKRKDVKVTIKADVAKLRSDRTAAAAAVKADRAQLKADVKAAREAKAGKGQLESLLQPVRAQLKQQRAEIKAALQSARQAVKALRASFKH